MSPSAVGVEHLRQFPFFAQLNEEELTAVAGACKLRTLAAKEWLFRAGDSGKSAFLVLSGRVAVLLRADGRFEVLDTFASGSIFGELCLIEQSARSADVRALDGTVLIEIDADDFARIQQISPIAAVKVIKEVTLRTCERLRAVNQRIETYLAGDLRSSTGSTLPPIALTEFDDLVTAHPDTKLGLFGRLLARLWS
jgi:CRP-like cAMP-binding protein